MNRLPAHPLVALTRHFFDQFLQNETIRFADQQREKTIIAIVILAVVSSSISFVRIFPGYLFVSDPPETWIEKCLFISIVMLLMAVISILQWDTFFLSRRDFLNLGHLPLRRGLVLAAKGLAIAGFVGLYCLGIAILSGLLFATIMTNKNGSLLHTWRYFFVHVLVLFLASLFVFLCCAILQALLQMLLPRVWFSRLSAPLQSGWLLLTLLLGTRLGDVLDVFPQWLAQGDPRVSWCPPLWFTALYEIGIGRSNPIYRQLAGIGLLALIALGVLFGLALSIGFARNYGRSQESRYVRGRFGNWRNMMNRRLWRHAHALALAGFISATVKRSQLHRRRIGAILAIGGGGALLALLVVERNPNWPLHSWLMLMPLHLWLLSTLLAIRSAIAMPVELEANWIFRLLADEPPIRYRHLVWGWFSLSLLLPAALLAIPLHLLVGAGWGCLWHILFAFALASLLFAIVNLRDRMIAFTCNSVPGKANLKVWFVPGTLALMVWLLAVTGVEANLLAGPRLLAGVALVLLVAAWAVSRFAGGPAREEICFEEQAEPVMISLGLNPD